MPSGEKSRMKPLAFVSEEAAQRFHTHLRLPHWVLKRCRKIQFNTTLYEDAHADLLISLVRAANRYDPANPRGASFLTYATLCLKKEIWTFFRGLPIKRRMGITLAPKSLKPIRSLDRTTQGTDWDRESNPRLSDMLAAKEVKVWETELSVPLQKAIGALTPMRQEVVESCVLDGEKIAVVARRHGVERRRFQQRLVDALIVLRKKLRRSDFSLS